MKDQLLRRYKCHKVVHAGKITEVGSTYVVVETKTETDLTISVLESWIDKHRPDVGGYFVEYEDGYQSFSPAKAFEDGYEPTGGE